LGFEEIKDAAGNVIGHAIVCTRGGRASGGTCVGCKRYTDALFLCDFPVLRRGQTRGPALDAVMYETTCDLRICASCKKRIGPDLDLCPKHVPLWDFDAGKPKVALFEVPPLKPLAEPTPSPTALAPGAGVAEDRVGPSGGDSGRLLSPGDGEPIPGMRSCLAPLPLVVDTDELEDLELPPGLGDE
jgi:hypothetical protein